VRKREGRIDGRVGIARFLSLAAWTRTTKRKERGQKATFSGSKVMLSMLVASAMVPIAKRVAAAVAGGAVAVVWAVSTAAEAAAVAL